MTADKPEIFALAGESGSGKTTLARMVRGRDNPSVGLSLAEIHGRYPHEFSGGQAGRVAIAWTLITRPSLIVADEMVSGGYGSLPDQVPPNVAREDRTVNCFLHT